MKLEKQEKINIKREIHLMRFDIKESKRKLVEIKRKMAHLAKVIRAYDFIINDLTKIK